MEITLAYNHNEEIHLRAIKLDDEANRESSLYSLVDSTNRSYVELRLQGNSFVVISKQNDITESDDTLALKLDELILNVIESEQKGTEDNEINVREIDDPYDPEKIRVDTKPFSLRLIYDMIESGDIDLTPDFQRKFVWDNVRKSQLIESILLRIPLPMFYFYQDVEGRITVVDGLQRLTSIKDFMDNKFGLKGLEYLSNNCENKYYRTENNKEGIDAKYFRWFNMTQITVNVIDPQSPTSVKFDIFRRINTGGKPLNNQEIRNCLASRNLREALRSMVGSEEFSIATARSVKDVRMEAQEMALRFIHFRRLYELDRSLSTYNGNMESTLDKATDELSKLRPSELEKYILLFSNAMKNAIQLFGKYAFRKIMLAHLEPNAYKQLINKALFVSWSVMLSRLDVNKVQEITEENFLAKHLAQKITDDKDLFYYLSYGTNGKINIQYAFNTASKILSDNLGDYYELID